ncbi:MAG: NAD(P)H-hydrate dehydratase [Clostridia bacterium]|nr:NAD(P)H-hydrate dehydratase [Clostridia bacterium]
MYILTSKQMFEAEKQAVNRLGITFCELMERAGCSSADIIMKTNSSGKNAVIVCGKGKNGGDGFVIARKLLENGYGVNIILTHGDPKPEDAVEMFGRTDTQKAVIYRYDNLENITHVIDSADIIIDCIFGTGFSGKLDEKTAALVSYINCSGAKTYAIDVPSGACCDSPEINGECIKADITVAISAYKFIHIIKPYSEICGKTIIADIGITNADYLASKVGIFTHDSSEILPILPERKSVSNKGSYGHALSICSSKAMQGASVLAAKGALRMGAGLLTVAIPDDAYCAVVPKLTEPLMLPLPCDEKGFMSADAVPVLLEAQKRASASLIGCGIGLTDGTKEVVYSFIKNATKPLIIDADGINAVACNIDILKAAKAPIVMTPHPGEMSRLCGKEICEILENPIETALRFATENSVTLVLKTANTVVCSSDGRVYINKTGNNGLSKGGSGDLLAGMLLSLLAQGVSTFDSAVCAVYLHGLVADEYAKTHSTRSFLPSDLADYLPRLLSDFEQQVIN